MFLKIIFQAIYILIIFQAYVRIQYNVTVIILPAR